MLSSVVVDYVCEKCMPQEKGDLEGFVHLHNGSKGRSVCQ